MVKKPPQNPTLGNPYYHCVYRIICADRRFVCTEDFSSIGLVLCLSTGRPKHPRAAPPKKSQIQQSLRSGGVRPVRGGGSPPEGVQATASRAAGARGGPSPSCAIARVVSIERPSGFTRLYRSLLESFSLLLEAN